MRNHTVTKTWGHRWRTVACTSLALAYFGFVGEAIHCQYFADAHHEHGNPSSKPLSHAAHCLVANHGTSVAIHSAQVSGDPPVHRVAFLFTPGEPARDSGVVLLKAARGPPAA